LGGALLLVRTSHRGGVRAAGAIPLARVDVSQHQSIATPQQDGVATAPQQRPEPAVADVVPVTRRVAPALLPAPTRVQLVRLHIDAPVVPVAADVNGALAVPDDPLVTGWWDAGARPGAQSGTVVIDGHVDSATRGLGAFFTLREARLGDRVVVTTASGASSTYKVVALRSYPKTALPAAEIFAQATSPRLVLVTCGGVFNRATHSYLNNVVIYAVPA
jgi:Sortase domain